jgi:hypothetical protein
MPLVIPSHDPTAWRALREVSGSDDEALAAANRGEPEALRRRPDPRSDLESAGKLPKVPGAKAHLYRDSNPGFRTENPIYGP